MIPSVRRPMFVTQRGILERKLPLLAVVDMERERDDRPRVTSSTLTVDGECELRSTALYESASSSCSGS